MVTDTVFSTDPKKEEKRQRLIKWLPPLAARLIRWLHATVRYRIKVPGPTQRLFQQGKPFILAFWHGRMLLMPFVYQSQFPGGRSVWTLISQHWDGELIARTVANFDISSIRGSSTRGGGPAFEEMVKKIQAGETVAITPDGPRGPLSHVHSGILRLAQQTGVPIVPVSWSARPHCRATSWDRFQVPLPFSRVVAEYGEPIVVTQENNAPSFDEYRGILAGKLNSLNHATDYQAREDRIAGWMFWGYNVLITLLSILVLPFFAWKIASEEKYRKGFRQRFGFYPLAEKLKTEKQRPLWIHAVSVGEVFSTVPFFRKIRASYPKIPVVCSTITPTGLTIARKKFTDALGVVYFPFDFALAARQALRTIRPRLFIHTETEIWPNFLLMLNRHGIPSAIVNGRISSRSSRNYGRFRFFFIRVLSNVCVFGMQTRQDCHRIIKIGADPRKVYITGNMKFDVPLPVNSNDSVNAVRSEMGFSSTSLVFVAGSTHAGEEEILLDVYLKLKSQVPGLKMLLAPRHPERCDAVERLARNRQIIMGRRTHKKSGSDVRQVDVLLLDTIGELARAYSIGDIVFVGGSLIPEVGGHNLLEPIMYQKPVLFGPYTENTADIALALKERGGGIEVSDREGLCREAGRLLGDPVARESIGRAAFGILEEHRGATERNLAILQPFLDY